jgi:hypothetical protein
VRDTRVSRVLDVVTPASETDHIGPWYVAGANSFDQWRDTDFLIPRPPPP